MINNRQNGRRRGRGGVRPQNGAGNGADRGNRIDNRARGNASQLHEKYKTLARDAQTQGDRVMTEYYLQFADHYFRVLSESRARFEEQRRPRDEMGRDDFQGGGFDADDYGDEGDGVEEGEAREFRQHGRDQRDFRDGNGRDNNGRDQRDNGRDNGQRRYPLNNGREANGARYANGGRPDHHAEQHPAGDAGARVVAGPEPAAPEHAPAVEAAERPRVARGRRPRRTEEDQQPTFDSIEPDRLPAAIAPTASAEEGEEEVKPKRRGRPRKVVVEATDASTEA